MIICPVILVSANDGKQTILGTLTISNVGGTNTMRNYKTAMYRKGPIKDINFDKPTRTGEVIGHRALAEPVHNLVAKALKELGYG